MRDDSCAIEVSAVVLTSQFGNAFQVRLDDNDPQPGLTKQFRDQAARTRSQYETVSVARFGLLKQPGNAATPDFIFNQWIGRFRDEGRRLGVFSGVAGQLAVLLRDKQVPVRNELRRHLARHLV